MFEAIDFKKSVDAGKIKWIGGSFLMRHFISFSSLFCCAFITYLDIFKDLVELRVAFCLFSILLFCSIYAISKNDKLIEVTVHHLPLSFRSMLEKEIIDSGRHIARSNQQYLTATKGGLIYSSRISVLYYKKSIFINVQNYQWNGYFPFSFGKNKRVANKFIQIITEADKNLS